ncbi:MAG: hypothetical protein QG597_632 [Actinomycetota bacterium]|nr:hypothetical protein [Actinomycetota bacterium]
MPETINGLPLHPLVVHAAVVLVPLTLVLSILILLRQSWRRSLGWWAVLLAGTAVVTTALAKETGEGLAEVLGEPIRHASLGDGLPYFAAAMFLMLTAYVVWGALWDWRQGRKQSQKPLAQGAVAAESVVPAPSLRTIEDPSVATSGAPIPPVPPSPVPASKVRRVPLTVTILGILSVLVAALATVQTFRVGESGAQAVWATELTDAKAATSPSAQATKVIPMSEVLTHNSDKDCWTVINGTVYDLSAWIAEHPGGSVPILSLCGTDGTTSFEAQHAGQAKPESQLAGFEIGTVR